MSQIWVIRHEFRTLILHSPEDMSSNILEDNDMLRSKHMFKEKDKKEENVHSCHSKIQNLECLFSRRGEHSLCHPNS